jgi:hypothetical protein
MHQGANGEDVTECHHFVEDGMIRFLEDSAHSLRGQIVPMVPF